MLLDTGGLLAFFDADVVQHSEATRLMRTAPRRLTHSYVLAEFLALTIHRNYPRARVMTFVTHLQAEPEHRDGLCRPAAPPGGNRPDAQAGGHVLVPL